jgi:hypothetical protein
MTATARFNTALITMALRGDRPRCSDPVTSGHWTAEDPADRAIAVKWCQGCPVLELCYDAAVERDEVHGVWGSVDLTRKPGRPKNRAA